MRLFTEVNEQKRSEAKFCPLSAKKVLFDCGDADETRKTRKRYFLLLELNERHRLILQPDALCIF